MTTARTQILFVVYGW